MKDYREVAPAQVRELHRYSKISMLLFLLFQIGGAYVLFKKVTLFTKELNIDELTNQLSNLDLESDAIPLPKIALNGFESFLSGASISMTSGFWLVVAWSGIKLMRPYSHKAYRVLIWSFFLQIFFFVLSFNSIFRENKSILNPGTLGSALTILFTFPIYLLARHENVKKWSQEFLPPPPLIEE